MAKISKIWAHEILDSRATPTVEAVCILDNGQFAISSVPSGASTGAHEALELRDEDPARYKGKGVLKAVNNVNQIISPALAGMDPSAQSGVDDKLIALDGTENKTKLGANAILAVSEAVAKAGAIANRQNLYVWVQSLAKAMGYNASLKVSAPLFNMINGGLHGAGNHDFQEFWVVPASSKTFAQALQEGVEIYMTLGENLKRRGAIHSIGDEGGWEITGVHTCGFYPLADLHNPTKLILSWASNVLSSSEEGQIASLTLDQLKNGAQLIVVDPRRTALADRADLWLQLRPGTAQALALGFLNVIIEESLCDQAFVREYTYGFEDLAQHVKTYSPEKVADITWVPPDLIRKAARLYATAKPAALQWGNAIEHDIHAFDATRSVVCLMAISGNLEVSGGNVNAHEPNIMGLGVCGLVIMPADKTLDGIDCVL